MDTETRVLLTPHGETLLRAELERRKGPLREEIRQDIATAREHGDLSENAEYHAAREQQGLNEARIKFLEGHLSAAEIIDPSTLPNNGRVLFGSRVVIQHSGAEGREELTIVGQGEASFNESHISWQAPIARCMLGKEAGETVSFSVNDKEHSLTILEVHRD